LFSFTSPPLSQEPHPLALPAACSPSPCAPFSALDLSLVKKTRDPLPPPIFLYFVLTLSAPNIISCLFLLPPTVSPPSHSPFHPFIPPQPLAPHAHLSLPQSFTCHSTSHACTHTHTREPAACSGLGGPRWLWSGSRGDVVGGEGLPTCLRSLAPEETWGPLPGTLLELRVGSATGAGRQLRAGGIPAGQGEAVGERCSGWAPRPTAVPWCVSQAPREQPAPWPSCPPDARPCPEPPWTLPTALSLAVEETKAPGSHVTGPSGSVSG